MTQRTFYILMAIVGTIVPWYFFGGFIGQNGLDLIAFDKALFVNGASAGVTADILITAMVFWAWSYRDAATKGIKGWWLVIPATLLVGVSLGLPMYLAMRCSSEAPVPLKA